MPEGGVIEVIRDGDRRVTVVAVAAALGVLLLASWLLVAVVLPSFDELPCAGVEFRAPANAAPVSDRAVPPVGGGGGISGRFRSLFRAGAPVVHCHDFADPFVLRVGDTYYAYSTNSEGEHVPVLTSGGLFGTARKKDALPELPAWSAPGFVWAPSVLQRGNGFVLYYATRVNGTDRQCLSVAVAEEPTGPFTDHSGGPLVCPPGGGAIDAAPFVDRDGRAYLLWKNYDGVTGIVGQELAPDGRSLVGPVRLLLAADQPWEGNLVEAPAMVEDGGRYYLFYSGNDWAGPNYGIGYAVCTGPLGPCARPGPGPWLASTSSAQGPGSPDVFTDENGQRWLALHSWVKGKVGYPDGARNFFVVRLNFDNGAPVVS
jgi:beta-xylosidase